MEQRITLLTLGVGDLDRSRAFYERLGWKRSVKGADGIAFFQAGGVVLSLYPRVDLARDAGVSVQDGPATSVAVAYNARDKNAVDAVLTEAAAAGGKILKPAADTIWGGYAGYFADPDGFIWEVAWNPHFPMDENGAIRLPD
jgi:hypothetical protein